MEEDKELISYEVSPKEIESLEQFWTEERMREAVEEPIPELDSDEPLDEDIPENGEYVSKDSYNEGGDTEDDTIEEKPVADTKKVPNLQAWPYRCVGKIFYTKKGKSYSASAWVTDKYGVLTAAHCVHDKDNGGYAQNIVFRPHYSPSGSGGVFYVSNVFLIRGWKERKMWKYDFASLKVTSNVSSVTKGYLGWRANTNFSRRYKAIGYPGSHPKSSFPFNGNEMWKCIGNQSQGNRDTFAMVSDFTPGASGGPWLMENFADARANGVNSHYWRLGTQWSPYFGNEFIKVARAIEVMEEKSV